MDESSHLSKSAATAATEVSLCVAAPSIRTSDGMPAGAYSPCIDGGLVPVALALEELGFVRDGSGPFAMLKNRQHSVLTAWRLTSLRCGEGCGLPRLCLMITGDYSDSPDLT